MTLLKHTKSNKNNNLNNLQDILLTIYCFVDDFIKQVVNNIKHALEKPNNNHPPTKKYNLSIAELVTLSIFRFFTRHTNWKDFYKHVTTYHKKDFSNIPVYKNFIRAVNKLAPFASIMLQGFMSVFRKVTKEEDLKFADSSKLKICENKRIFNHKVCKDIAKRGKGSMGWFYGFKLHIICNELMQILKLKITTGNADDRKTLEMMWNNILGTIVADAGYIGKNWREKAREKGKILFTSVRANMKKIMTETQHTILKMRQRVESVFSVLKLRMGIETTLPRSPLGYFAHYLWCITAYQLKKFFGCFAVKQLFA